MQRDSAAGEVAPEAPGARKVVVLAVRERLVSGLVWPRLPAEKPAGQDQAEASPSIYNGSGILIYIAV